MLYGTGKGGVLPMGDFQWTLTNRKKERDAMLIDREKKDLFMEMRRWTLMRVKRKKERRKRLNAQQAAEGHEAAVGKRRLRNKPQSLIEVSRWLGED